ncbi:MAG: PD40 domain-containing protein [Actinobacteria bacterium]|nr:PD40 domain-containing protein [Actinomycetota bacterium]
MGSDGSAVRRVVSLGDETGPTWSADSRSIAFGRVGGVWVVRADGTALRRLTREAHSPAWSPGGRWIAFDDGRDVVAISPDGRRRALVATPRVDDAYHVYLAPAWSRDGERLAFSIAAAPDTISLGGIGIVSRFGGPVTRISLANASFPDWSPSGRKLAVAIYGKQGGSTIATVELRTGRVRTLRSGTVPRWSPDGRSIAFADDGQIYVMDANGSNPRQLTSAS